MKDAFYFQHDFNARNDHKTSALISDHGATGYGVYWCLIEMLHEETDHALPLQEFFYRATAKQTSTSVEQVLNIIKDCLHIYNLFVEKDGFFYSERVLRNINKREETREKRSAAGKISAEKRKCSTGVQQKATKENKGKESKEKEIEDKSSSGSEEPKKPHYFIALFNEVTGRDFKVLDSKSEKQVAKLRKQGYGHDDFKKAITAGHRNSANWDNPQLFTPEYITRESKFMQFLYWDNPGNAPKPVAPQKQMVY